MQKLLQHLDNEYHLGGLIVGLLYTAVLVFLIYCWMHGGGQDV